MCRRICVAVAVLAASVPILAVGAQSGEDAPPETRSPAQGKGIPPWSVTLDFGRGPRTHRAGDAYYLSGRNAALRLSAGARIGGPGAIRPVVHAEGVWGGEGGELAICGRAPDGSCYQYPPKNSGGGLAIGLAAAPHRRITATILGGRGRYGHVYRSFADAQLALAPFAHVALVGTLRQMRWKQDGAPHWFRPFFVGVRVQ